VVAAVFKTVGPYASRAAGGFDSHALPPFSFGVFAPCRNFSRNLATLKGLPAVLRKLAPVRCGVLLHRFLHRLHRILHRLPEVIFGHLEIVA